MSQAGQIGAGGVGPYPPFGPLKITFVTASAQPGGNYTVLSTDSFISITSDAPLNVLMPNTTVMGRIVIIKDRTGTAKMNPITIKTPGGIVTIDGSTTVVMDGSYDSNTLVWDGTAYEIW